MREGGSDSESGFLVSFVRVLRGRTYVSGTAVKISSSSFWSSSSVLVGSSEDFSGSHEATRRWLRDRATLARLRITSDSLFESDISAGVGVVMVDKMRCFFLCRWFWGGDRAVWTACAWIKLDRFDLMNLGML